MDKPIGEILNQWKTYLTNISRNLMELSEQTDVKLIKLKAKDAANGYTGLTKIKAVNCVQCLEKLWQYYAALSDAIDKANELNEKNSFLNNTEKAVREIFDTATIVIETEHIDINNRNLLSSGSSEKRVTPKELLEYMEGSFESLCKDIKEISQATKDVQARLSNMKRDISKLNSTVKGFGISNIPEFDIDKVTKIEGDPLKGVIELDKLVYSIEKYRASIKAIEVEYNKILNKFNEVSENISELKNLAEKSKIAIIESKKLFGITESIEPIISEEVIKSLQDWQQVLQKKLSEGYLDAVKIGISRLEKECFSKLEIERESCYLNCRDYNDWLDLKGQFKALLAKSEVLKAKGLSADNSLKELIDDTQNALYAKPVNLNRCKDLVGKFQIKVLNGL